MLSWYKIWKIISVLGLSNTVFSDIVRSSSIHVSLDHVLFYFDRLELENRLVALEQQRVLQDAANQAQNEDWEERLHSAQQGEESARREVQNLR